MQVFFYTKHESHIKDTAFHIVVGCPYTNANLLWYSPKRASHILDTAFHRVVGCFYFINANLCRYFSIDDKQIISYMQHFTW